MRQKVKGGIQHQPGFIGLVFFLLLLNHHITNAKSDSLAVHASSHMESLRNQIHDSKILLGLNDSSAYHHTRGLELEAEINRKGAFTNTLTDAALLQLPVGIQKQVGVFKYTIILSKVTMTPKASLLEAYFMLEIPKTGDRLAFRGTNIPFSNKGGMQAAGKLQLVGDYDIALNGRTALLFKGGEKTFVEFDCNGFKGMGIEGELSFSREWIIPEDANGSRLPNPAKVAASISTYAQSWNDLMLSISLPPFQVVGLKDFTFHVDEAFLDWSDVANPSGLTFPEKYSSPFQEPGLSNLWQGIFLKSLRVSFPPSFTRMNKDERISLSADNMILDDAGVTGSLSAENVFPDGDMNGWVYTMNNVSISLVNNQLEGFGFGGVLSIPIVRGADGKPTMFDYQARISDDENYIFAVAVSDNLHLPLLLADLTLDNNSKVIVESVNGKFYPSAVLNGSLSINNKTSGVNVSLANLRFEGLTISSVEPRFRITSIGLGTDGNKTVGGYPVVLKNISVKQDGHDRLGLTVDMVVNLVKATDDGFGAAGTLTVWGKRVNEPVVNGEGVVIVSKEHNWDFDRVDLSSLNLEISKPDVFTFAGSLKFYEKDEVYGSGFKGKVSGSISKFGGIQADAIFGRTQEFRYWFADALMIFEHAVPIVPGVIAGKAFGGGYYHHMKQTTDKVNSTIGVTQSGICYVPLENNKGVRAIAQIVSTNENLMNGDVALDVSLSESGGIREISLNGNANFMNLSEMAADRIKELMVHYASGYVTEKLSTLITGQVYGTMKLNFDNVNNVFHGNFDVYVNVAAGLVRGVSNGNLAGWAEVHFAPDDWHILIGTPDKPLGIEIARLFRSESYLMAGKNLPGSPPPDPEIAKILGGNDFDYLRDFNQLQSGNGLAMGLRFKIDTGDKTFLMFYGRFAAGVGADVMMTHYPDTHCSGSSDEIGINGWYANGQAYAFIAFKIGIKVNLKFYKGNYEILNTTAGAILQMKGPNPFWMQGTVGGSYRILGGLVKGNCRFVMTIGEECKPVSGNQLEDIQVIAQITPANGAHDVDVFNTPQVAFNIAIGKTFRINDLNGDPHTFKAELDYFDILSGTRKIDGSLQWNDDNNVLVFDGHDILPGTSQLTAKVKITFYEQKGGTWEKVKLDGKIVEEQRSISFTTAEAPNFIADNHVAFTYPIKGQLNFFPEETGEGVVALTDGRPDLFLPKEGWTQALQFVSPTGETVETTLSYNAQSKHVYFKIPTTLKNESVYTFQIVNIPHTKSEIDLNLLEVESVVAGGDGSDTLSTKDLEGEMSAREIQIIYNSYFRTSKYNTFKEKMANISLSQTQRREVEPLAFRLYAFLNGTEGFDRFEISPTTHESLIRYEANLAGNDWYWNYALPVVYEGYPLEPFLKIEHRDTSLLGLPPIRDVYFNNFFTYPSLQQGQIDYTFDPFQYEAIVFNLGETVNQDYLELQNKVANYYLDNTDEYTARLKKILIDPAPYVRYGAYKVRFSYVIPGLNKLTSNAEWQLFNEVTDHEN